MIFKFLINWFITLIVVICYSKSGCHAEELDHISSITEQLDQSTRLGTMETEFGKQMLDKPTPKGFAMSTMIIGIISQVDIEKIKNQQNLVSLVTLVAQQNKQLD